MLASVSVEKVVIPLLSLLAVCIDGPRKKLVRQGPWIASEEQRRRAKQHGG